jgi:transposase
MPHLSAEAKHHILLEYAPHDATRSFAALARRHAVKGGKSAVKRWHDRWDGTPVSLQEQPRSGRPRILSAVEVSRHVRAPILAANRAHRAIHYTELLPRVQTVAGQQISLRTVQRYGKEELGTKQKRGQKRTADESECNRTCESEHALLCMKLWADSRLQCRLTCVSRSQTCVVS